jgi:DNA-binding transcriptional ArsR family regulator
MRATLGPVAESIFALDLFMRNNSVAFTAWRRHVRRRLGHRADDIQTLVRTCRPLPDLLWLVEKPAKSGEGRTCPPISAALFEFCQAAVVPYWSRMRAQLELEREVRGRIVITKGVNHMLGTLHPKLRWRPPVLEVPGEPDGEVHLNGRGLLLSPSLFLYDRPCVVIDADRADVPATIAFSLPLNANTVATLCSTAESNEQALSALVGHTRAAALQALADSCTTSELARRLNISAAGASQHATVLREAGLITTCRNRNTVLHALTPLGVALLRSGDFTPGANTALIN